MEINDKVTITCYGKTKEWNRKDAIKFYAEAVLVCDGSEKARYANILAELALGDAVCTDILD